MVERRNSQPNAINSLPDEILGDILWLTSAKEQDELDLTSIRYARLTGKQRRPSNVGITRVSRRWRFVSIDHSTLWLGFILDTKQDLTRAPRALSHIPERVALHIHIEPEMEADVQEGVEFSHRWRAVHPVELKQALSAVSTRAGQIRTLFARVNALMSFPVLFSSGISFPNLVKLHIEALATMELDLSAPKLRELWLMRTIPHDSVRWTELFTPHLRSLSLDSHYGAVAYDVGILDALFTSCPLLKQLNIGLYCSQLDGASSIQPGQWKGHSLKNLSASLPPKDAMRLLAGLGDLSEVQTIGLGLRTSTDTNDDLAIDLEADPLPLVQVLTAGLTHVTSFDFSMTSCVNMEFVQTGNNLPFVRNFSMVNSSPYDEWDTAAIWRYLCTTFSAHRTIHEWKISSLSTWNTMAHSFAEVRPDNPDLTLIIEAEYLPRGQRDEDTRAILVLPAPKRVVFDISVRAKRQRNFTKLAGWLFAYLNVQRESEPRATEMCFCSWRRFYEKNEDKWDVDLDSVMQFVKERGEEAMWTLCEEQRVRRADQAEA